MKQAWEPLDPDREQALAKISREFVDAGYDVKILQPFVNNNSRFVEVIEFHKGKLEDLEFFCDQLLFSGCGIWHGEVFVPALALSSPNNLDFIYTVLKRKDAMNQEAKWMYICSCIKESVKKREMLHGLYFERTIL